MDAESRTEMSRGTRQKRASGIPILTFHDVDDRPAVISFPPDVFRAGFVALQEKGYRTLDLCEAICLLRSGKQIPEKCVVITFDDGFQGVYENAFPMLRRLGMTATVFLSVGGQCPSGFAGRLSSLEGRSMLSWEEIREMHSAGITFGAHTLTHPDLTGMAFDKVEEELLGSKRIIEDALGVEVTTFAYPFGRYDTRVRELVGNHFNCACSDRLGVASGKSDPLALERIEAYYFRTEFLFSLLSSRLFPWYLLMRAIPRGSRRRVMRIL